MMLGNLLNGNGEPIDLNDFQFSNPVNLLESGGLKAERETQSLYEGESIGIPYELDTTRSRYFGGSTNCWGGFSRPFQPIHFTKRDWVPYSGWPFNANRR